MTWVVFLWLCFFVYILHPGHSIIRLFFKFVVIILYWSCWYMVILKGFAFFYILVVLSCIINLVLIANSVHACTFMFCPSCVPPMHSRGFAILLNCCEVASCGRDMLSFCFRLSVPLRLSISLSFRFFTVFCLFYSIFCCYIVKRLEVPGLWALNKSLFIIIKPSTQI